MEIEYTSVNNRQSSCSRKMQDLSYKAVVIYKCGCKCGLIQANNNCVTAVGACNFVV